MPNTKNVPDAGKLKSYTLESLLRTPVGRMGRTCAEWERPWCVSRIRCNDGTELSVQASSTHYCTPRENSAGWFEVEVGYPSVKPPDSWREYYDGDKDEFDNDGTGSVYGYVPAQLVREYIKLHGGEAAADAAEQQGAGE